MKSVSSSVYSATYFSRYQDHSLDNLSLVSKKNGEILSYIKREKPSKILDFGCGAGILSILIAKHLNISVYGIDYSPDAIKIAKQNLKSQEKQINPMFRPIFQYSNNRHLPKTKDIDLIIMADVIEHLYDWEIKEVFTYFRKNYHKAKILIHTDNNLYLKTTQKILNMLNIFITPNSKKDISKRQKEDVKMHVNLTTESSLTAKLAKYGYSKIESFYPTSSIRSIQTQLGPLSRWAIVSALSNFLLNLPFVFVKKIFMPSFYAIYQIK